MKLPYSMPTETIFPICGLCVTKLIVLEIFKSKHLEALVNDMLMDKMAIVSHSLVLMRFLSNKQLAIY